jgi:hypothetical protein
MAKVLGVGGIFFKSRDPKRLYEWYAKCLEWNYYTVRLAGSRIRPVIKSNCGNHQNKEWP